MAAPPGVSESHDASIGGSKTKKRREISKDVSQGSRETSFYGGTLFQAVRERTLSVEPQKKRFRRREEEKSTEEKKRSIIRIIIRRSMEAKEAVGKYTIVEPIRLGELAEFEMC